MDAENGQAIIYAKESDEITRKLSLKSSEGGYKVTIVWLPEKMHEVCANKLLKLLEEPPEKTIFLLISEAPEMILPTILSRTQRFNIPKIEEADIAGALQQKYGVQPRDSETIAHLANGDFIKALETIHLNEENELFFNLFVSLMRLSYQRKIREMKLPGLLPAHDPRELHLQPVPQGDELHDAARTELRHPLRPLCQRA